MSFKLSVRQGPRPNLVFELDKPSYVIGREAGNDLVIEDPQVSRRHAQLTQQGNSYLIEDIGSTNGTYVNGKRVTAPTLLTEWRHGRPGRYRDHCRASVAARRRRSDRGERCRALLAAHRAGFHAAVRSTSACAADACLCAAARRHSRFIRQLRFSLHRRPRFMPRHVLRRNTRNRKLCRRTRRLRMITLRPPLRMTNAAPCSSGWAAWDCCWWCCWWPLWRGRSSIANPSRRCSRFSSRRSRVREGRK